MKKLMKKLRKKLHKKKFKKLRKRILLEVYFRICKTGIVIADAISVACALGILGLK